MRRFLVIVAVLVVLVVGWEGARRVLPSSIDYRGERIKLSKLYLDYDDYKNDLDNIHASETRRVQALVKGAPIARSFADRKEAIHAVREISFPGYGSASWREERRADGSHLTGLAVEIPRAGQDRSFVFRVRDGRYTLVDDFVTPAELGIAGVTEHNGSFVFSNLQGQTVLTRPARPTVE